MFKFKATDRWYKEAAKMEEGHEISAGVEPKSLISVLTGPRIQVYVKGRELRGAVSLVFKANAKEVCTAVVRYIETGEDGRIKQVEYRGKFINKENEFGAYVTSIENVGGRVRFNVMPRSFVAGKQNDFTVEDEKYLLAEILKSCVPEAPPVPEVKQPHAPYAQHSADECDDPTCSHY